MYVSGRACSEALLVRLVSGLLVMIEQSEKFIVEMVERIG